MRLRLLLILSATLLLSLSLLALSLLAQDAQTTKPCITPGERIYEPGVDGVNPPQPTPDKGAKDAPKIRGPISLELIVNAEGNVCSVKILAARDTSSAQQTVDYISRHWRFKPATRKGKPVAVTMTMNFRPS